MEFTKQRLEAIIIYGVIIISAAGTAYDSIAGQPKSLEVLSTACVYGKGEIVMRNIGSVPLYKSDWGNPTVNYLEGIGNLTDVMSTPDKIPVGGLGVFTHQCGFDHTCEYIILAGREAHRVQIHC